MANYIFGLPGDTEESINNTFQLSLDLCTLGWNAYAAMALPGSQLYKEAVEKKINLPENYEGYSFHSYNTLPLSNKNLTAAQILKFRDEAFTKYHKYRPFLNKIKKKFGEEAVKNIKSITEIKLKRRIIEENIT